MKAEKKGTSKLKTHNDQNNEIINRFNSWLLDQLNDESKKETIPPPFIVLSPFQLS